MKKKIAVAEETPYIGRVVSKVAGKVVRVYDLKVSEDILALGVKGLKTLPFGVIRLMVVFLVAHDIFSESDRKALALMSLVLPN
jgi:hypothetical protein